MNFDKKMTNKLGVLVNVDKTIQELQELTEKLRDWKTFYFIDDTKSKELKDCIDAIQEERVDVSIMMKRLDAIFNFSNESNKLIGNSKIKRTINRYLIK